MIIVASEDAKHLLRKNSGSSFMNPKYRTTSEANIGTAKILIPEMAPIRKDEGVRSAIRKDSPTPTVVKASDVIAMERVDGKAMRRARL
jgi:hypothetical protein